jgi:cell division protein FtsB
MPNKFNIKIGNVEYNVPLEVYNQIVNDAKAIKKLKAEKVQLQSEIDALTQKVAAYEQK